MLRLDVGYMFEESVKMMYEQSDDFWDEYQVSLRQFKSNMKYLYGLLQSATRSQSNPYFLQHKHDKDSLQAWIKFEQAYSYGGSKNLKSEELKDNKYVRKSPTI